MEEEYMINYRIARKIVYEDGYGGFKSPAMGIILSRGTKALLEMENLQIILKYCDYTGYESYGVDDKVKHLFYPKIKKKEID